MHAGELQRSSQAYPCPQTLPAALLLLLPLPLPLPLLHSQQLQALQLGKIGKHGAFGRGAEHELVAGQGSAAGRGRRQR